MPAFYYLPKAVLAAVVISSVMFLVEYEEIKPMWKSRSTLSNNEMNLFAFVFVCSVIVGHLWARQLLLMLNISNLVFKRWLNANGDCKTSLLGIELLPLVLTFFSCLLVNMEFGIILGAGFHLLLLLHMGNKPKISVGEIQAINVIKTTSADSTMVSSFWDLSSLKEKKTPINLEKGQPRVLSSENAQGGEWSSCCNAT